MKQALRPEFFSNLKTIVEDQKAKAKGVSTEEQLLFSLSNHAGWRILNEYIDNIIRDLDKGTATAMAQGLPFEEIGRNAVVIDLAKGVIKNIQDKVNDAREAVENGENK